MHVLIAWVFLCFLAAGPVWAEDSTDAAFQLGQVVGALLAVPIVMGGPFLLISSLINAVARKPLVNGAQGAYIMTAIFVPLGTLGSCASAAQGRPTGTGITPWLLGFLWIVIFKTMAASFNEKRRSHQWSQTRVAPPAWQAPAAPGLARAPAARSGSTGWGSPGLSGPFPTPASPPAPRAQRAVIRDLQPSRNPMALVGAMAVLAVLGGALLLAGLRWKNGAEAAPTPVSEAPKKSEGAVALAAAEAAYAGKDFGKAASQAEIACRLLGPEAAPLERRLKARRILASSLYKQKDYERAYQEYVTLSKADPKDPQYRKTAREVKALMIQAKNREASGLLAQAEDHLANGRSNRARNLAGQALQLFRETGSQSGMAQASNLVARCDNVGTSAYASERRRQADREREAEEGRYYWDY